jgi:putative transposase
MLLCYSRAVIVALPTTAGRVNGIIKEEYLNDYQPSSFKLLDTVIGLYNKESPHMSIGNLTPNYVHENNIKTERLWKNYYTKKL